MLATVAVIVGLLIYPVLAIFAKRWHDHDCTGWKAVAVVQPIGGLWDMIASVAPPRAGTVSAPICWPIRLHPARPIAA